MNRCACVAQYHIKPSGVSVGADKRIVCDGLSKGPKWAEQGRLGREQGKDRAGGRAGWVGNRARTGQGAGQRTGQALGQGQGRGQGSSHMYGLIRPVVPIHSSGQMTS